MKKEGFLFQIILILTAAVLLVTAWKVDGVADAYREYLFPLWIETIGRLTGLAEFSVGEIMLYAAAFYLIITLIFLIIRFVLWVNKNKLFKKFTKFNIAFLFRLVALVIFIQVLNCFVLYPATKLYEGTEYENVTYTYEDLFALREKLVTQANAIATYLNRDENNNLVYNGDMGEIAVKAMTKLGKEARERVEAGKASLIDEDLSRLKGYFSKPKPLKTSKFFSQQYMAGYYFPFSLEANYNTMMYISNYPSTMCHELAHLKGFILEDEASFISYLACVNSDNQFFYYSGLLDAITYVNQACNEALNKNPDLRALVKTSRNELVMHDMVFLTEEAWQEVEATAVIKTETVKAASEAFVDTNLTLNGVEDGIESYGRMVDLLLRYDKEGETLK